MSLFSLVAQKCSCCCFILFCLFSPRWQELSIEPIEERWIQFDEAYNVTLLPSLLYPNCVYFIGGEPVFQSMSSPRSFQLYNLETKEFKQLEEMPFKVWNGKGLINPQTNELCVIGVYGKHIAILNESTVKWKIIKFDQSLVADEQKVENLCEAVFDDQGKLHIICTHQKPMARHVRYHCVYNFSTKTWARKADLPSAASTYGGFINLDHGKNQLLHFGGIQCFIYDCEKDEWIQSVYLPSKFERFSYVTVDRKLIVFGHWCHSAQHAYIFDLDTFQWNTLKCQMTRKCTWNGCASGLIDNRILILGGYRYEEHGIFTHKYLEPNFIATITSLENTTTTTTAATTTIKSKQTQVSNTTVPTTMDTNNNSSNRCHCDSSLFSKQALMRILKFKSIYMTVIIHFSDVMTDYLVLIQYIFHYYYKHSDDNVNYLFVSLFSFLTIFLNKLLSSYYVWQFTQNIFDVIFNVFDFYIFKEVLASHESGNKTDLLMYLQKIERIFESSPQFAIQTYVVLRGDTINSSGLVYLVQILSILLSLYAISDKIISDDKFVFIQESGANKSWLPTPKFIFRVLFRVCEVIANLLTITIVSVFFGVYLASIYLCYLLFINFVLYRNDLLGKNKSNIFAHLVAVINLGVIPTHNAIKKNQKCVSKTYKCVVLCIFNRFCCFYDSIINYDYGRSLSFYLIITRIISGIWVISLTIIFYYATSSVNFNPLYIIPDKETRYVNSLLMQFLLWIVFACYILQFLFYKLIFSSMHLGMSLERDVSAYVLKYKFSDAIRLQKIKKRTRRNNIVEIVEKVLNIIVERNVPLVGVAANTAHAKGNRPLATQTRNTCTKEQKNEHLYLIKEITKMVQTLEGNLYDESQVMLCNILSNATFHCHLTMMQFIIGNKWIKNICDFEINNKNILCYILENCSHRNEILVSIFTEYDECFDGKFGELLSSKTSYFTKYGSIQCVIHQLISNVQNTPQVIEYLSQKYYQVFFQCNVLKYILMYDMHWFIDYLSLPFLHDYMIDGIDLTVSNITPVRAKMFVDLLVNHKCNISSYKKYNSTFRRLLFSNYLTTIMNNDDNNEDDVKKLANYLTIIPNVNEFKDATDSILGNFIYCYSNRIQQEEISSHENDRYLKLLEYLLVDCDCDINCSTGDHGGYIANIAVFAIMQLNIDGMELFFKCKANEIDWHFNIRHAITEEEINHPFSYSILEWFQQKRVSTVANKQDIFRLVRKYRTVSSPTTNITNIKDLLTTKPEDGLFGCNSMGYSFHRSDDNDSGHPSAAPTRSKIIMKKKLDKENVANGRSLCQQIFEEMLRDSFDNQNFVLFDILIDLWNNKLQNKYGRIDLLKFGKNNQNSLIEMIGNEHGDGKNVRNLSIAMALFEKHVDFEGLDPRKQYDISRYIQTCVARNEHLFVCKLCQITGTHLLELYTDRDKIVKFLINDTKNKQDFVRATATLKIFSESIIRTKTVSYELMNDCILCHPNAVEWIKWLFINNEWRYNEQINTKKILLHPQLVEIIDTLETSCGFMLNSDVRLSLFFDAFDRDSLHFLNCWFNVLKKEKKASQLMKEILDHDQTKNYGLEKRIQSLQMIDFLVNEFEGWKLPHFDELLKIVYVSPCLVKYIIEKQRINITLNHLKMRMKHVDNIYFDIFHLLLVFCNENVKNEFYNNIHSYGIENDELINRLKLLFDYSFCNIDDIEMENAMPNDSDSDITFSDTKSSRYIYRRRRDDSKQDSQILSDVHNSNHGMYSGRHDPVSLIQDDFDMPGSSIFHLPSSQHTPRSRLSSYSRPCDGPRPASEQRDTSDTQSSKHLERVSSSKTITNDLKGVNATNASVGSDNGIVEVNVGTFDESLLRRINAYNRNISKSSDDDNDIEETDQRSKDHNGDDSKEEEKKNDVKIVNSIHDIPYIAYFSAKKTIPNLQLTEKTLAMVPTSDKKRILHRLIHYFIKNDDDHYHDIIGVLVSNYLKFVKRSDDIYMIQMLESSIIHNNYIAMKQILDERSSRIYEKDLCRLYKIATYYNNQEIINCLKNFKKFRRDLHNWGHIVNYHHDHDNGNYNSRFVMDMDVSTENKENVDEHYFIAMNFIENSLIRLYNRYINTIDNQELKNEFVENIYCNPTYFHNHDYVYHLRSASTNTIISTRENEKGIYLFESIVSDVNVCNLFNNIINVSNDNNSDDNVWLLRDIGNNGQIPLECIVFRSYNEKYQRTKFQQELNQEDLNFLDLMHKIQRQTLDVKLKHII